MVDIDPAHILRTGGAVGALCRHVVSQYADIEGFPAGTFTVNVLGSFALAAVTFAGIDSGFLLFFGTGVCGSFTTFSSFSFETVRLWETGERFRAVVNAAGNLIGAGLAIALAWVLIALVM